MVLREALIENVVYITEKTTENEKRKQGVGERGKR